MQFQHGTQIGAPANASNPIGSPRFITNGANTGSGFTLLTNPSQTWLFTVQQIFVSWQGVTTPGQIQFQYTGLPGHIPIIIYQTAGIGNLVVPMYNAAFGGYGLIVQSNGSGGTYFVMVNYTLLST